jgi:glycosyl transferase family 1
MKIYVMPADKGACGHNRLIWPGEVLRNLGHDVVLVPPVKGSGFAAKTRVGPDGKEMLTSVTMPEDIDVLVIQRPTHRLQPQLIAGLRANGIAVVVDMDDDMSTLHPSNVAFQMYRTTTNTEYSWKVAAESCKQATMVITSTAQLQKVYARPGHGRVIDNYVPQAYLNYPKMPTGSFGWAGTMQSHPNDPQVMGDAVRRLAGEGYQFSVVGDGHKVKEALRLPHKPPATGGVSLVDWAARIADSMDVGVVPLAATSFNTSKSRLKGIEMSAVGVPWVASPRTEYRRLVKESGCGILADSPKQWYAGIKLLMDDEAVREEHVQAGRQYMRDQTYEANAWRWLEAWTDALKMERGTTE